MAKPDTVYSLFGLKTPQQVAAEQLKRQNDLLSQQQSGFGRAGAGIGLALRNLFSGPSDEMQKAQQGEAALAKAREDIQAKRTAEEEAKAQQALSIDAAIQAETMGNMGEMQKPAQPTREEELMSSYMKNSELYDAMATRLAEAGFNTEAEAARTAATEQRLEALKARKTLAETKKLEAEANAQDVYKNIQINENNYMDAANAMIQAGDVTEGLRLIDIYRSDPSTLQKDLSYILRTFFPGQDHNDPQIRQLAMDKLIDYKRADQKGIEAFKTVQTGLDESLTQTKQAANKMPMINRALSMLDDGRVNIGSLPGTRQGAEKLYELALQAAGIDTSDQTAVARTEELLATTGQLATYMLASGVYGSGTGLSEKDLEDAKRLSGASADLTPDGMRRILELNAKMAKAQVAKHNTMVNGLNEQYWRDNPYKRKDNYIIEIEPVYTGIPQSAKTWAEAKPKGNRAVFDTQGQEVRFVDGVWQYADGTIYSPPAQ